VVGESFQQRGKVVKGGEAYAGRQGLDYTPGVSAGSVGSRGLWLGSVVIPSGARTKAHVHEHHESAFYVLEGERIELWTGENLEHCATAGAGDYLYIPANIPHVAVNRGSVPAVCVGARTDPSEQESVVMRPDLEGRVP
jgi:uncharacterized RmlC-like cupin family protein